MQQLRIGTREWHVLSRAQSWNVRVVGSKDDCSVKMPKSDSQTHCKVLWRTHSLPISPLCCEDLFRQPSLQTRSWPIRSYSRPCKNIPDIIHVKLFQTTPETIWSSIFREHDRCNETVIESWEMPNQADSDYDDMEAILSNGSDDTRDSSSNRIRLYKIGKCLSPSGILALSTIHFGL